MNRILLAIFLIVFGIVPAVSQEPSGLSEEEVVLRTERVSKTLRCVVCQNQSIYDSNAPLAEDMRRMVEKRVRAGDSDDEAREYLRDKYGDYILMKPPLQINTVLLWASPFLLVLIGAFVFRSRLRNASTMQDEPAIDEADLARIKAALKAPTEPSV